MPYNFNHKKAGVTDAPITGWYLALPFSFSNPDQNGSRSAVAYYQRLVFVVEFSMDQASTDAFSTWTNEDLRESGSIEVVPAKSAGSTLLLTGVNLEPSFAQHSVQAAKTILGFGGIGAGTTIAFQPKAESFLSWGKSDPQNYAWNGCLKNSSNDKIMLLSHAYLKWNKQKYFEEVQFAGPAMAKDGNGNDAGSLFNTVAESFEDTILTGAGQEAQPGKPINQIAMKDGRRSNRDAVFFGAKSDGGNQVATACGAIWIAHGSFLHLGTEHLQALAKNAYEAAFPYDRLLGHQSLKDTMLFGAKGSRLQADEAVFEGLSVWGLGARNPEGASPVLM